MAVSAMRSAYEGVQARMPHFYKKTGFLAKFAKDEIVLASSNMK